MKEKKKDAVLRKVAKQDPLNPEDLRIVDELLEKGLIKETEEGSYSYTLTTYGELISVMGYKTHKQTEKLEQNFSLHSPKRSKMITIILLSIFIFLTIALLLLMFLI